MEAVDGLAAIKPSNTSTLDIATWKQNCYDAMNDDFNSPILIAQLFEGVRFINVLKDNSATITAEDLKILTITIHSFVFDVLGLKDEKAIGNNNEKLEGVIHMLINMRMEARANKDFAMSDQIRDQLIALGIQLKSGRPCQLQAISRVAQVDETDAHALCGQVKRVVDFRRAHHVAPMRNAVGDGWCGNTDMVEATEVHFCSSFGLSPNGV